MKPINIVTISDLHWNASRLDNFKLYKELQEIFFKTIYSIQPEIIIIVGDLMDSKVFMNSDALMLANKFIYQLYTDFPNTYILLLHGTLSHDYMQLDAYNHYIGEKFRIYKTLTVDYIDNLKLLFIPEEYYPDKSVYDPYLKLKKGESKYDFVFLHGMFTHVGGYANHENSKKNKIVFNYKDFEDNVYGIVNCGHIHINSEYKNIDYNGSFSRWTHGEETSKGFYIYTYDVDSRKLLKKQFIENTLAPIFKTIYFEHLPKDTQKLYEKLKEYSESVDSLRINLSSQFKIPESQMVQLVDFIKSFDNISLLKSKLIIQENEENQDRIQQLQTKLSKYHDKTFEEMTIMFARDELDKDITKENIIEALS